MLENYSPEPFSARRAVLVGDPTPVLEELAARYQNGQRFTDLPEDPREPHFARLINSGYYPPPGNEFPLATKPGQKRVFVLDLSGAAIIVNHFLPLRGLRGAFGAIGYPPEAINRAFRPLQENQPIAYALVIFPAAQISGPVAPATRAHLQAALNTNDLQALTHLAGVNPYYRGDGFTTKALSEYTLPNQNVTTYLHLPLVTVNPPV